MASKILKQAQEKNYATGGIVTGTQSIESTGGERVIPCRMTDEQIDAILQARLKQINNRHLTSDEL